jgi:excisionase family DNA binding protein
MPNEPRGREFLTIPEIVDVLHMSKPHAYRLVKSGALPAIRFGTGPGRGQMLRVRAADLERFVAEREAQSCPAQ